MNLYYNADNYSFKTISEFKTCMRQGGEVVFSWRGREYGIWSEGEYIRITCSDDAKKTKVFRTADAALEYTVGGDRLRDVITQVTVLDRTI